jgi:hypothetical protein
MGSSAHGVESAVSVKNAVYIPTAGASGGESGRGLGSGFAIDGAVMHLQSVIINRKIG